MEPCSEISQTINGNVGKGYSKTLIIQHLICFPVFTGVDFYALLTIFYVSYMTQSDTLFIRHENALSVSVGLDRCFFFFALINKINHSVLKLKEKIGFANKACGLK